MSVTLIHTADWQLGRRFGNVPGDAGAALRDQRVETVKEIARLAQERHADAIVVCGDVFETNAVADRTIRQALNALKSFTGDWVFIPGNHDAALADSVWNRADRIGKPDNVHFLLHNEKPLLLKNDTVAILPAVLQRRHEADDLTEWFDRAEAPAGAIRVGIAHGSVQKLLPEASEAPNPIAADRAETAKLDYLALGDWHGTFKVNDHTWYAGTPEPDRFKSNDPGNVLAVEIERPGAMPSIEKISVGHHVWRETEFNVRSAEDIAALERDMEESYSDPAKLLIRLKLEGVVTLALREQLREKLEEWEARLRYLETDDRELIAEPSEDDLDRIDRGGFVRTAVEQLRTQAADSDNPERAIANAALLRLYQEHVRMEKP